MTRLLLLPLLVAACDGVKDTALEADTDTDTDTDTDADADTDTDADTDADADPVPETCPEPGLGLVEVTVSDAAPAITASDELSFALFPVPNGPPSYFFTGPGADATTLPSIVRDNTVPPGAYEMMTLCMDSGGDTLNTCDGPGDVLLLLGEVLTVEADRIISIDVDYATGVVGSAVANDPDTSCP